MDADLTAIKAALAEVSDTELAALITATYGVPQTAPGLMAWIEHASDWEQHRRRDFDFPLQPPEAAIDPSEDELNINAAIVLRDQFAEDSTAALAFFDALVELLTGAGRKPVDLLAGQTRLLEHEAEVETPLRESWRPMFGK